MTGTPDPFLALAERQIAAPVKARMRAAATRAAKRTMREALAERDDLYHLWKLWRRERVDALLAGPYGAGARALIEFLQRMTLASSDELIDLVQRGPWREADADVRFEILAVTDAAIIALREKQKLPPYDDPLPFGDEKPNTFLQLRHLLS
jgi:hypothetical protein